MSLASDLLRGNTRHVERFDASELQVRPRRRLAVLTCMDSRYTGQGVLGLALGDAHVIRNAGGRVTDDVIRSLALSAALLGTNACVVVHHTDCGLLGRSDEELQQLVAAAAGTRPPFSFLPFDDVAQSVRDDLGTLRACSYLPAGYEVVGFVYDVRTGRLEQVDDSA
ncbi:MAG: carbonic anhydrase [Chloroflexi bacterium]|nr:carbonic anhydrase [Chloroflexota bacterium]